ncbi:helix-turn-helix domain-containing protein [Metabacillus fastidiosus]|uniref:helix-turn-helix domain-containing protein n=1 Tax=Metabacillus fastidiosus TaxID=1458 RepID=UPI003D2AF725
MIEMEKVEILLRKETVDKIKTVVNYENYRNQIYTELNRDSLNTLEDFITGCVNLFLNKIESRLELAGLDDLGKPYRLKNRFREIVKAKGMKQKELAELTKIDAGNISIILSNKSQPSLDYFLRIWITLGCPPIENVLYREEVE